MGEDEFLTMVGPSGCGKSTLMRLVSGLETETSGDIYLNDQRVNDVPTRARNIGFMFQGYALFMHMTVADNIAFGLRIKKFSKKQSEYKQRLPFGAPNRSAGEEAVPPKRVQTGRPPGAQVVARVGPTP